MSGIRNLIVLLMLLTLAAACIPAAPTTPPTLQVTPTQAPPESPAPPAETQAPVETTAPAATPTTAPSDTIQAATNTPEASATSPAATTTPELPEEAILILEPGPGSRVTSPIRVAGEADPTFEQNLVVRVLTADGVEVLQTPTNIQAEAGQRGSFEVELPVELNQEENIFIQVFASSARDGGITHLASTGVIFTPSGPADIRPRDPQPEQIVIFQPTLTQTINGGVAHVEGFALASFEQTLVIEVQDMDGNVIGTQPVIVEAPDLGIPGPFSADVPYTLSEAGPGRIAVIDPSPAFGGEVHLASVEVNLEP
ncbi:MAG: hypothetical protein GX495_07130 [Chloroflexi bacterium]|nr:hypothetical protein [Chloroflexota bacterium]